MHIEYPFDFGTKSVSKLGDLLFLKSQSVSRIELKIINSTEYNYKPIYIVQTDYGKHPSHAVSGVK